ncbi:hypothetical protein D9M71_450630 [compost metagenome]
MAPFERGGVQAADILRAIQQLGIGLLGQCLQRRVHRLRGNIQCPLLRLHLGDHRSGQRQAHAEACQRALGAEGMTNQ